MKRNSLIISAGIICIFMLLFSLLLIIPGSSRITVTKNEKPEIRTLFPYQCIDTMKTSRDKARELVNDLHARTRITNQIQTIASLGANCVAVGTPYDKEFVPFLTLWVTEARKAGLAVWFRGNLSSWEGWFDYPKNESTTEHTVGVTEFIRSNPMLFRDGDIFSPTVEPENGGPFAPVDSAEKTQLMRDHLRTEQREVKQAFRDIGVDVTTSWVSFSGGVAKGVLDEDTIASLDNTVTLDHYVKSPTDMASYLDEFHGKNNAKLVLGEFGAPIPDINGEMNPKKQAEFVDKLFSTIYARRSFIGGTNYWTLEESSTALLDEKGVPKPVVETLKKYYIPTVVHITSVDRSGDPLKQIPINLDGEDTGITTDERGEATLVVPQGSHRITLRHPDGTILVTEIKGKGRESLLLTAHFAPENHMFVPLFNSLRTIRSLIPFVFE